MRLVEPGDIPRLNRYDMDADALHGVVGLLRDDGEWVRFSEASAALAALVQQRDEARSLHQELMFQVGQKCPGETRHETAKRYLREREALGVGLESSSAKELRLEDELWNGK